MRLEIYMSDQNSNYQEPLLIAEQASQIPGLEVTVIKVDDPDQLIASFGKAPAYLFDSQIVSLEPATWRGVLNGLRSQAKTHIRAPAPSASSSKGRRVEQAAHPSHASENHLALRTIDIFRDLREEDLSALYRQMTQHVYCKGQVIYLQEERAEGLYFLTQGRVLVYRLTASGKRLELATVRAGTFFGEEAFFGDAAHYASAEAVEDTMVGLMSRTALGQIIQAWPAVALQMIHELSQRIALSAARLEELAYQNAPARLAAELLRLSQGRSDATISITHQELGEITGMLRETVTKMLNEFRADGLVELRRGRIFLRDGARLQRILRDYDVTRPHRLPDRAAS